MKRRVLILAGISTLLVLAWSLVRSTPANDPFTRLGDALPRDVRTIEPRLSGGFKWAPFRSSESARQRSRDPRELNLRFVAGTIVEQDARTHVAGVAQLLVGHPFEAIKTLKQGRTAAELSDLAAAYYVVSAGSEGVRRLTQGLTAADGALELEPRLQEARFNRALFIEQLGLREAAREAWQAYLDVDHASHWASEAGVHIKRLSKPPPQFRELLASVYAKVDDSTARRLVIDFPQESRTWGETEILGRWGDAFIARNAAEKELHLHVARAFGRALNEHSGEPLLAEAVETIDRSAEPQRVRLAEAHSLYRRGRIEYGRQNVTAAEPLLRTAVQKFESAGSPMSLVGRYYAASALYDQNDIDHARRDLAAVHDGTPSRFIALRAQVGWATGLCHGALGEFGKAIEAWKESVRLFHSLGERLNAASVEGLLADAHETVGAFETSWRERLNAIRQSGHLRSPRLATVLSGAARTAIRQHDWPAAATFLRIEVEAASATGPPQLLVDTLLRRAYVLSMLGRRTAAVRDVDNARHVLATIADPARRDRGLADAAWTEALLITAREPAEAVRLLTIAMDFHSQRGRRSFLPDLFLSRGRAHLRAAETAAALSDFDAGIAQLETERRGTPISERLGLFDTANDLFEEAIALEIDNGRVAEAFGLTEQSRARTLLDKRGATYRPLSLTAIAPDTTIIEYALIGNRLVVFTVSTNGIEATTREIARSELEKNINEFRTALEHDDRLAAQRIGESLHDLLIGPLSARQILHDRLVVVPAGALERLPFAALVSPVTRRYLVEDHTIVIAPSAAVYVDAGARRRSAHRTLLAVADPRHDDTVPLDASLVEAERIARLYASPRILSGLAATREAFAAGAPDADVIHYAGHAVAGEETMTPVLLLSPDRGSGSMDGREIAALKLRASVVVLASCATAQGEVQATEGTASLARAFLTAGAPSVIATLWPIDDERAAPLFTRLHQALTAGVRPAEALRSMQLESIRRASAGRDTLLWASIQCIGS